MNFKFKVGDEVHHKGWKVNALVSCLRYTEDHEESFTSYDMFVVGEKLETINNVPEFWLEEGHRIE